MGPASSHAFEDLTGISLTTQHRLAIWTDGLGANPAQTLIQETGQWALRWLWLTLLVTPLREMAALPALVRYRRTLGVTAFVYAVLHLLSYAWLDKGWVIDDIVADVFKRNFILVGMLTFLVMLPLALTSFNLGWEVPGPYNAAIEIRGLRLRAG